MQVLNSPLPQTYTFSNNLSESSVEIYTLEDLVAILEQLSNYLEQSNIL